MVEFEIYELVGQILEGSEYDELFIGSKCLSYWTQDWNGKVASLVYYISDTPIQSKNDAVERMLTAFYKGSIDANADYCHGSSWTGIYARNDSFEIGGHDIIEELKRHLGEHCFLELKLMLE